MKAIRYATFGPPEVLELVDVDAPEPGPSQIRVAVRAVGINPIDWKIRGGAMGVGELPRGTGVEAAGVVETVGASVDGVAVGDRVFGSSAGAAAELALMSEFAQIPDALGFAAAAALPVAVEAATRCLDLVGVESGQTLLINGASGSVGIAAVQLARRRGARVIGSGGERSQDRLRSFGAEPVRYGDGLADAVRALAPDGVDRAIDMALSGGVAVLVALTGGPDNVVAIGDYAGAEQAGVRFSGGSGETRARHALADVAELIERGEFTLPVAHTFGLTEIAEAQRLSERGHPGGKIVVTLD